MLSKKYIINLVYFRKITEKDDQLEVMESKLIQIREEYASLKDKVIVSCVATS